MPSYKSTGHFSFHLTKISILFLIINVQHMKTISHQVFLDRIVQR